MTPEDVDYHSHVMVVHLFLSSVGVVGHRTTPTEFLSPLRVGPTPQRNRSRRPKV